jgi:DNA-binding HxlR family transcriptional regulator
VCPAARASPPAALERNSLAVRDVHPTVPPRVEYKLTEPDCALRATVDLMCG